jgi:hypothetical protein
LNRDGVLTDSHAVAGTTAHLAGAITGVAFTPRIEPITQLAQIEERECSVVIKSWKAHSLSSPYWGESVSSQAAMPDIVVADK